MGLLLVLQQTVGHHLRADAVWYVGPVWVLTCVGPHRRRQIETLTLGLSFTEQPANAGSKCCGLKASGVILQQLNTVCGQTGLLWCVCEW